MRTIQQQRAENALERVDALPKRDEFRKSYRAYADSLGPTIVMNGLGQALATEKAAAGENPSSDRERAHFRLYENVSQWLCRRDGGVYPSERDVLKALISNDEAAYLLAQVEALAWLEWHKKFCRAYLPADEPGGSA